MSSIWLISIYRHNAGICAPRKSQIIGKGARLCRRPAAAIRKWRCGANPTSASHATLLRLAFSTVALLLCLDCVRNLFLLDNIFGGIIIATSQRGMKSGILYCLLLLGALGGGYWAGRHNAIRSQPSTDRHEITEKTSRTIGNSASPETNAPVANEKFSLAEIEERIRGFKISDAKWGMGVPPAWANLFQQISADDMPEVLTFVRKNTPRPLQRVLLTGLIKRWADVDPQGAITYASKLPQKSDREFSIDIILASWSSSDAKAATRWVGQLPPGPLRNEIMSNFIAALAVNDPRAAFDLLQKSGTELADSSFPPYRLYSAIFGAWAASDPVEAARNAAQLQSSASRLLAFESIASTWAATDPAAAMAWATTIPEGNAKLNVTEHILRQWGNDDPASAFNYLEGMHEGRAKQDAINQIGTQLAAADPKRALALAQSLLDGTYFKEDLIRQAMGNWITQDQAAALDYAQNLPAGSARNLVLESALRSLAMKDPKAALSLSGLLPPGQGQTDLMSSIANGLAQTDPQAAVTFAVQNLTVQGHLNIFMNKLASDWARKDPDAAKNFWQNVPEGPSRDSFIEGLMSTILETSTADAATFISGLPPGNDQSRATASLMVRWASEDPEAAAKWAATLSDEKSRVGAYQNLVMGWAFVNPTGASQWLAGLPDDENRQSLAQTFVSYIGTQSPSVAAPWADSLTDVNERNKAIQLVGKVWLQTDADRAKAWLATTSLPDDLKQRLLKGP
jgi:hypothetical protein